MNYAGEDCPTTGNRFQLSGRRGADEKFAALIIVCDLAAPRRRIRVPIYTESPQVRHWKSGGQKNLWKACVKNPMKTLLFIRKVIVAKIYRLCPDRYVLFLRVSRQNP